MKQLLWTIQDEKAFREFERTGVLRANKDFLFCQEDFWFAYDWISKATPHKCHNPHYTIGSK